MRMLMTMPQGTWNYPATDWLEKKIVIIADLDFSISRVDVLEARVQRFSDKRKLQ